MNSDEPELAPSPAAERMRRHRQRRRSGLIYFTIELRKSEIEGLVRRGFLSPETRNERHQKQFISILRKNAGLHIVTRNRPNRYAQQEIARGTRKTSIFDFFIYQMISIIRSR
jgi:hypothetical protein